MSRRKPYDRGKAEDDWGERSEWRALVESNFEGIPREALIASIRYLAGRLLVQSDILHEGEAPRWPEGPMTDKEVREFRAAETMDVIRSHHGQSQIRPAVE